MNILNRASSANPPKIGLDWRVLGTLNLYRILVPLVLLGLYSLGGLARSPGGVAAAFLRGRRVLSVLRLSASCWFESGS